MGIRSNLVRLIVACLSTAVFCQPAFATDGTWIGPGEDWNDADNWQGGHIASGIGATASFTGSSQDRVDVYTDSWVTIGHIVTGNARMWSLYNGWGNLELKTNDGQPTITTHTSSLILESLRGDQGFVKRGSDWLQLYGQAYLSGNVVIQQGTLAAAGPDLFRDDVTVTISSDCLFVTDADDGDQFGGLNGSGTLEINGAWIRVGADNQDNEFSGTIEGPGDFGKTGTGTMTLSGANTFSGTTTVLDGTLRLTNPLALQKSTVELSSMFDLFGLDHTFGALSGSSDFELAANMILTIGKNNKDAAYSGNLSGDGGVTKIGNGSQALTGTNSYLGNTTLRGGKLIIVEPDNLGTSEGFVVFDGGILRIEGTECGSLDHDITWSEGGGGFDVDDPGSYFMVSRSLCGSGDMVKQGSGMLTLTGDNSGMTGDVHIENGILRLGHGNALGDSQHVIVDSGATLEFTLNKTDERIGALTGSGVVDLRATGKLTVGDDQSTEFSGTIKGDTDYLEDGGRLVKVGSGTLTLSGDNWYYDGTIIREGTLSVHKDLNLGLTGDGLTIDGGFLQVTGTTMASTNHAITFTDAGGGFDIAEAAHTFTVDEAAGGVGRWTKRGPGTLALSGSLSYSGGTEVEGGTLQLTGDNSLQSGEIVVHAGATLRAGQNDSLGDSVQVSLADTATFVLEADECLGSISGTGCVETGGFDLIVQPGGDTTFGGSIVGTGKLIKNGTSLLTLSGSNSFTGGAEVLAGTLRLGGNNAEMGGVITVSDGATLRAGIVDSLGPNTRVDLAEGGTLILEEEEWFGSLAGAGLVDTAGYEIDVGEDDTDSEFSGVITGSGDFVKKGLGTQTLSGNNEYTGDTIVRAGTLRLSGNNHAMRGTLSIYSGATLLAGLSDSLENSRPIDVMAGGTFVLEGDEWFGSLSGSGLVDTVSYELGVGWNNADTVFSGTMTGNGSLLKSGSGSFTLSGDNNFSGGTALEGGELIAGSDTALGSGIVVFDGGTLLVADGVTIDNTLDFASLGGGTLSGTGTVRGNVSMGEGSTLSPGDGLGVLAIDGDYAQGAAATMQIELAGISVGQFDALDVTGMATLGGSLELVLTGDYEPLPGDEFVILTGDQVNGLFDSVFGPAQFEITYNSDSVVVSYPLGKGDLNCDGMVDVDDIAPFALALLDPTTYGDSYPNCDLMYADINDDGEVNGLDIQPFVGLVLENE